MKLIDDSAMHRLLTALEALVVGDEEPGRALNSAIISIGPLDERSMGKDPDVQEAYTHFHKLFDEELKRVNDRGDGRNENRFVRTTKQHETELRQSLFKLFSACYENNWHFYEENRRR